MQNEIVAIRLSDTNESDTKKITDVRLKSGKFYTLHQVILDIRMGAKYFYTTSTTTIAYVEVVNDNPPYIRTQANQTTKDNLLNLPKF